MFAGKRRTIEDYSIDLICYFLLFIMVFVTLYPFYFIVINSLNEGMDAARGGIYLWPRRFTFENYAEFFNDPKWMDALFVTAARTIIGTPLTVFFTCMVAYGLSHKNLMFKKTYFILFVFSMYFSGGLVTYFVVLRSLGLLNNFLVYIIPWALNTFFLFVATAFFRDLPQEMIESGYIDGAGDMKIYFRIVIPVSMPLIATMLLFIGVTQWNSWFDAAYFVRYDHLRTLGYRMIEVINQSLAPADAQAALLLAGSRRITPLSLQMAAMIVATAPIIFVYPFLQKHFIKGMMLGSVKG